MSRSVPYRAYHTYYDADIAAHYGQRVGPRWDGSYVIWFGPPGLQQLPAFVEQDNG